MSNQKTTRPPIVPVSGILYGQVQPRRQTRDDACSSFAVAHALQLQKYLESGLMEPIHGEELHRQVLRSYYESIPERRSRSFEEILDYLNEKKEIRTWANIQPTVTDIKRWLLKKRPPLLKWSTNKVTHSLCVVGFDDDTEVIYLYDPLRDKWREMKYADIEKNIKSAYVIFT